MEGELFPPEHNRSWTEEVLGAEYQYGTYREQEGQEEMVVYIRGIYLANELEFDSDEWCWYSPEREGNGEHRAAMAEG